METLIKKIIQRLWPELTDQRHLTQYAQIVAIPSAPKNGQLATDFDPRYAVNIQMLDQHQTLTGPIFEDVPLPVNMASHSRGLFGFAQVGTRVAVNWAYGDAERPVIIAVYPTDKHLPTVNPTDVLLQQSSATHLHATEDENWLLTARNKVRIGNKEVDLVQQVETLSQQVTTLTQILANHTHPKVGSCSQAEAITQVGNATNTIQNQVRRIRI